MVGKGKWFIFPYLVTKEIPGLRLSPAGVKEERNRRSRYLGNYSYSNLKSKTLPIAAISAMQYCRALERLIREVVISNPALGPVHVLKADVRDGLYRIFLRPMDTLNLGMFFILEV